MLDLFLLNLLINLLNILPDLPGFDLALNYFVPDEPHILEMIHLYLIEVCCDLCLLPLVVQLSLILSALNLLDFLLEFTFPLLNSKLSLGYLTSLLVDFFFSTADVVFSSLKIAFVGCSYFGNQGVDIAWRLADLLGKVVYLNTFLELLSQVLLLVFEKLALVLKRFSVLHLSVLDVNFVKLRKLFLILFNSSILIFKNFLFFFFLLLFSI